MDTTRTTRHRRHLGIPVLIAVGALSLGACSSGGDDAATDAGNETTTTVDTSGSETSEDRETTARAGEATALMPVDAVAPEGYTMVTARCDATDAAAKADDATPADSHRSAIVFAAPEAWSVMGSGSGGSGSVLGTDGDVELDSESGERVTVDYEWDGHTAKGEITDFEGEPWMTFDYEVTTAGESTSISYDKVATVTVGDQDVDLYYRDPSQAPDDLSAAQYKARINAVEVPRSQAEPDVPFLHSFVVTIEFDPEASEVTQDVIETMIGSYSLPSCTWDDLIQEQELMLQMDLDGDGEVRSAADQQKELEEQLAELEKQQSQGN